MNKINRPFALLFVLLCCVGCDQATKALAGQHLAQSASLEVGNRLLLLAYAENPGAFMGLGAALPAGVRFWVLTVGVLLLLAGALIYVGRRAHRLSLLNTVSVALIMGGGLSNWLDRLLNEGRVIDFMQLGVGMLRTGVFNVADMAISTGVVLLLASQLRRGAPDKESPLQ
jgi:signal peptidase II